MKLSRWSQNYFFTIYPWGRCICCWTADFTDQTSAFGEVLYSIPLGNSAKASLDYLVVLLDRLQDILNAK